MSIHLWSLDLALGAAMGPTSKNQDFRSGMGEIFSTVACKKGFHRLLDNWIEERTKFLAPLSFGSESDWQRSEILRREYEYTKANYGSFGRLIFNPSENEKLTPFMDMIY